MAGSGSALRGSWRRNYRRGWYRLTVIGQINSHLLHLLLAVIIQKVQINFVDHLGGLVAHPLPEEIFFDAVHQRETAKHVTQIVGA
jgi:hypothetical protein